MAKKKAASRLQATTPEDLAKLKKKFRKYADRFEALAKALSLTEEKAVEIEGFKMLDRGLIEVEKFIANCQKKIREF